MIFEAELAEIYDSIYRDKDYEREVDFIEEIFQNYSLSPVKSILDGGCGTGSHALPLARRDYEVTGIDISATMIRRAREKANKANLSIKFHNLDLRQFDLPQKFDACLCMFAVLCYITDTGQTLQTLEKIRNHLNKDSLFIFDCWNGLAVIRILPSVRANTFENGERRIVRIVKPELDAFQHLCRVNYHIIACKGDKVVGEFNELHMVRFFSPRRWFIIWRMPVLKCSRFVLFSI